MRWTATLAALVAAAGLGAGQQPGVNNQSNAPFAFTQKQTPADLVGGAPAGSPKVCVYEPKATKKVVYGCDLKEYCAPDYSPLAVLRRCLGHNTCDGPCPPEPLVKRVLVKKVVPGPDKMVCALKDAPPCLPVVVTGAPGMTAPAAVDVIPPPPGLPPAAK